MKTKIILTILALAAAARAQVQYLDTTTPHTNTAVTTGAQLTVPGYFFNQTYAATNTQYITTGDSLLAGWAKINSTFNYFSNQVISLANLPNQINTNMAANIAVVSNEWLIANAWLNSNSNRLTTLSNTLSILTNNFIIVSNEFASYLATNPVGGKMNFDNALITSDGSSGIITVHHTGSYGDPTGGARVQGDNSPVNSSDPNNINFIGPNQDGGGSGGYDILETADRMIDFHANGYTSDNTSIHFNASGRCKFDTGDFSLGGSTSIVADAPGVTGGHFIMDQSTGYVGINNPSPAYFLDVAGTFACDTAQIYSDGSGNLTAQTFNPISDRARKENIQLFASSNALAMALSLTNYTWRFKARTNWITTITRTTNSVTTNGITSTTNLIAKVFPPSGKEIGPMAQEWHAATGLGGGTNISMTSMAGLLLGAVQELAARCATNSPQTNATTLPLRSPNGTAWYLHVSNSGQLTADPSP